MKGMSSRARNVATLAAGALLACVTIDACAAQWFVETDGVDFSPQFLTIQAGDSVTFLNRGGYHNVVADDGSFRCAHGCDGDGHGGSGNASSTLWIATVSFPTPGTVGYFCEPHGAPGSGMYGTIQVLAPLRPVTPVPGGGAWAAVALAFALVVAGTRRLRRRSMAERALRATVARRTRARIAAKAPSDGTSPRC